MTIDVWRGVMLLMVLLLLAWVVPEPVHGADIYRWQDADGVVHYADRTDVEDAVRIALQPWTATPPPRRADRRNSPACVEHRGSRRPFRGAAKQASGCRQ